MTHANVLVAIILHYKCRYHISALRCSFSKCLSFSLISCLFGFVDDTPEQRSMFFSVELVQLLFLLREKMNATLFQQKICSDVASKGSIRSQNVKQYIIKHACKIQYLMKPNVGSIQFSSCQMYSFNHLQEHFYMN